MPEYDILKNALKNFDYDGDAQIRAELEFDADAPVFDGHFPGNPILPGFCQLEIILMLMNKALSGSCWKLKKMKNAKFFSPILPGDRAEYNLEIVEKSSSTLKVNVHVSIGDTKKSTFKGVYLEA